MKYILGFVVLAVAGYFALQQAKPKPLPPPPPPPPVINAQPQPIIDPAEQAKIIKATNDMDAGVRWESLVLLDKMKSPQAMQLFTDKLLKDPEPDVRIKICKLLGERKGPDVSRALVAALKDSEPNVRVAALLALDSVGDYSTASAITDVLKDQEESVRVQALKTLNSLQDKKAAEIAAEQKRQEELRQQALEAAQKR